ncbi:MAG: hypothetical protein MUC65_10090 [Pontiellaceae bacterium]|nr:hypothetical protein [Pontiellaceae bacterium]
MNRIHDHKTAPSIHRWSACIQQGLPVLVCLASLLISGCTQFIEDLGQVGRSCIALPGGRTVGMAAVKNLTDQNMLADVACSARDGEVRIAAVKNLTDQNLLAEVASSATDKDVRAAAVRKLTCQSVLTSIATEDKDADVRKAATAKLKDLDGSVF